jgi:hypothetical protein
MLKSIFKRTPADSALEEVIKTVETERRLRGFFMGYAWAVVVGRPSHGEFEVECEGAWRRNPEKPEVFAAWKDDAALNDFLAKKKANQTFVETQVQEHRKRNPAEETQWKALFDENVRRIEKRVPYPPIILSQSAEVGFEFDLGTVQGKIEKEKNELLFHAGILPLKPSLVGIWSGAKGLQPILKIHWNGKA